MSFTSLSKRILVLFFLTAFICGCSSPLFGTPSPTSTPVPTNTPLPSATPTATAVPYFVQSGVWTGDLQVPILIYHNFSKDSRDADSMHTPRTLFREQLQKLYDAGFSLISLSSWLDGSFTVPEGRKPLILTIDDGIFADQLYINDDGTPSDLSGVGILWLFAQEHPDFGFEVSINVVMGDKYYGDVIYDDWFYNGEGDAWKTKLANAIVWAIENGVELYNHTFTHVDLSLTDPQGIQYQLKDNDLKLREYLELVNRSDLAERLGNIIVMPMGKSPSTISGVNVMKNYINPEGKPVTAVLGAYNADEALLTPSIFSASFDRWNIPRTTATEYSIEWVISKKDEIPTMENCPLGPTSEEKAKEVSELQSLIKNAVESQSCQAGVYQVSGFTFIATADGTVTQYFPQ